MCEKQAAVLPAEIPGYFAARDQNAYYESQMHLLRKQT